MADKRIMQEKCHICGDYWDVDFMIDDAPLGMVCVPCNELVEAMADSLTEELSIH